jgi:phosphatidylserine/phosphatidylglycerophosphate/cardiolipin synthase-like enzyme
MAAARELVRYAEGSCIDPFAPDAAARLQGDPAARVLLESLPAQQPALQGVLFALQVLQIQRSVMPDLGVAEFVATVPAGVACAARPTSIVIREMLGGPHHQIIALGYEISDDEFVRKLHEASLFCPEIFLLCDHGRQSATKLRSGWPGDRRRPQFFENVAWVAASPMASMHCKALLVDGSDLLVTSANFTFHGLKENIEFGVRLGGQQVRPARDILFQLLRSGLFRPVEGEEI